MQAIDEVFGFLKSGEWYSLKDVTDVCSIPECKIGSVLKFLTEFDFLQVNNEEQNVRLHPNMKNFINGLHENK